MSAERAEEQPRIPTQGPGIPPENFAVYLYYCTHELPLVDPLTFGMVGEYITSQKMPPITISDFKGRSSTNISRQAIRAKFLRLLQNLWDALPREEQILHKRPTILRDTTNPDYFKARSEISRAVVARDPVAFSQASRQRSSEYHQSPKGRRAVSRQMTRQWRNPHLAAHRIKGLKASWENDNRDAHVAAIKLGANEARRRRNEIQKFLQQPLSDELKAQIPPGITEASYQFLQFVLEQTKHMGHIPIDRHGREVISPEMLKALREVILERVSVNQLRIANVQTTSWDAKDRALKAALSQLAHAFHLPKAETKQVLQYLTQDARLTRRGVPGGGLVVNAQHPDSIARAAARKDRSRKYEKELRNPGGNAPELVFPTATSYLESLQDSRVITETEKKLILQIVGKFGDPAYLQDLVSAAVLALKEFHMHGGSSPEEDVETAVKRAHQQTASGSISIDEEDSEGHMIRDNLVSSIGNPEDVITIMTGNELREVFNTLTLNEQQVLTLLLGLNTKRLSIEEVADFLKLTLEEVKAIQATVLEKIQHPEVRRRFQVA